MDTTFIVIIVLVIAALIALGIHLNERRKKRNKAKHAASKKAHPSGNIIPADTIQAKHLRADTITTTKIKTELNSNGHHVVQQSYTAPTFRKETSRLRTSTPSTPKADSYKARYDDNYYPSNSVTDAALLAALISSQSVDETEGLLREYVSTETPQESSYSVPSSSDSGSNGSYSNSYDSNGSSGGYSSYESSGSSPSWSSDSSSSSSSSSSSYDSGSSSSSYSSDSGSSSFSFD